MDPTGIVIGAVGLVLAGVVVHVVTRAAARGDLEVNAAIGIRTRLTSSSQPAWRAAHLAALPLTLVAFLLSLVVAVIGSSALVLVAAAGVSPIVPVLVMVAGYVGFLVVLLLATRAANRAARSSADPGRDG